MTLLVAGADPVDAGKTTFATGLVAHTGAVGFKPRAGNDFWFSHDDVRTAIEQARLFGADATALATASPGTLDPEDVNPVHRLWRPSPGPDQGLLGQEDREFLVDRVGDRYVVNATVELPQAVREHLPLEDALSVASTDALNDAIQAYYLPALDTFHETVRTTANAVVESYSDVARPLQDIQPEAVAVVQPRQARLYRGPRFVRACEVATRSPHEGQLEERVASVEDLVDPEASIALPALGAETRKDPSAVADAYGDAYEELLAVAETVSV